MIAVVKANAYNLGIIQASWALEGAGADFFAVATPDEAIELREGGITSPVLVLVPHPTPWRESTFAWDPCGRHGPDDGQGVSRRRLSDKAGRPLCTSR